MRLENPKCTLKEWMLHDACMAMQTNNDNAKCLKWIGLMQCPHE